MMVYRGGGSRCCGNDGGSAVVRAHGGGPRVLMSYKSQ